MGPTESELWHWVMGFLKRLPIDERRPMNIKDFSYGNGAHVVVLADEDIEHLREGKLLWVEINGGEYAEVLIHKAVAEKLIKTP